MYGDDFPQRVRRARERLMLNRPEFAKLLQVSAKTVQNWESGKSVPKNRMGALEQYLDVVVEDAATGQRTIFEAKHHAGPSAGPSGTVEVLDEIEARVRESGLFRGRQLDQAIALAKESYFANQASGEVERNASAQ